MMIRKIRQYTSSFKEKHNYVSGHYHSAQEVGVVFVKRYYKTLRDSPEKTYKYYKNESMLSRLGDNGMRSVTTIKDIEKEIMHSDMTNATIILLSVQAQDTVTQCVVVSVTGLLSKGNMLKSFSQTFVLAPQAIGFYVLNDLLQFIDMSYVNTSNDTEYYVVSIDEMDTSIEEDDVVVLPHEQNNAPAPMANSFANTDEDVKKLSSASIVPEASSLPSPNATVEVSSKPDMQYWGLQKNENDTTIEAVLEVLEDNQKHKASSTEEVIDIKNGLQVLKNPHLNAEAVKMISVPVLSLPYEQVPTTTHSSAAIQIGTPAGNNFKKILVKDLPPHVTCKSLIHALKDFGLVKHKNIQIRGYPDGYRYAFVEFSNPRAANQAVKSGSINFDGWKCRIERKRVHIEEIEGCYGSRNGGNNINKGDAGDCGN